jgi:TonB family protein
MRPSKGLLLLLICILSDLCYATQRPNVAVVEANASSLSAEVSEIVLSELKRGGRFRSSDRLESEMAARGAGYSGSTNLTTDEARSLGQALGADYYFLISSDLLRRSSSTREKYFEAYATLFFVRTKSGELLHWNHLSRESDRPEAARAELLEVLKGAVSKAYEGLQEGPAVKDSSSWEDIPIIEGSEQAEDGITPPKPFRRMAPAYPSVALQNSAEATVDLVVTIGPDGKVDRVEVKRWAGFGLIEAATEAVRKMNFLPAQRDGSPFRSRVLLRYNFSLSSKISTKK